MSALMRYKVNLMLLMLSNWSNCRTSQNYINNFSIIYNNVVFCWKEDVSTGGRVFQLERVCSNWREVFQVEGGILTRGRRLKLEGGFQLEVGIPTKRRVSTRWKDSN